MKAQQQLESVLRKIARLVRAADLAPSAGTSPLFGRGQQLEDEGQDEEKRACTQAPTVNPRPPRYLRLQGSQDLGRHFIRWMVLLPGPIDRPAQPVDEPIETVVSPGSDHEGDAADKAAHV